MIELRAVEVDVEGKRALDSANYTLTERSGLTLFRLDWRDPEQGDEWQMEEHVAYVTRKMAELVDLLDESDLLDGITDFYHP